MTAKDILQIEVELGNINSRIGKLDTGIAVVLEQFKHILTREDLEKEVSRQIKLEQADCPSRRSYVSSDKIKALSKKPVPIKDLIYMAGILGAGIAGYLQ